MLWAIIYLAGYIIGFVLGKNVSNDRLKHELKLVYETNSSLDLDYSLLKDAVRNLRLAQEAYMGDRGNEELGKKVAAAAFNVDNLMENIQ